MDKKYEVLLMDLDNTLFDFEVSESLALKCTAEHFKIGYSFDFFEKTYHEINKPLWQALERGEIDGETIKWERFNQLVKRLQLTCDPSEMSTYYIDRLSEGIDLFVDAEAVCIHLKTKYKLVALTNGIKSVQENRMHRSGLIDHFDEVIISEEVGVSKPHAGIFDYALKKINHKDKRTVLMIGDSMKADILGAHQIGVDTCWVNLKGEATPEDPVYKWEINSLNQLFQIL